MGLDRGGRRGSTDPRGRTVSEALVPAGALRFHAVPTTRPPTPARGLTLQAFPESGKPWPLDYPSGQAKAEETQPGRKHRELFPGRGAGATMELRGVAGLMDPRAGI